MPIFNPVDPGIIQLPEPELIKAQNVNAEQTVVNTTTRLIIEANVDRLGLIITNTHSSNVFFDVKTGVLDGTNYMFVLKANGIYELPTAGAIYTGDFYARAVSGGGTISYREFTP